MSRKRNQHPLVEVCAITTHEFQGRTYAIVIYEYNKGHDRQLVNVALSRASSLECLCLTNCSGDHTFYRDCGRVNTDLCNEFCLLENHKPKTIVDICHEFVYRTYSESCDTFIDDIKFTEFESSV